MFRSVLPQPPWLTIKQRQGWCQRETKSVSVPSHSVLFCPAPATLCNHKVNKAGKESEKDKKEKQKPENLAELTLVTFLAFGDCCPALFCSVQSRPPCVTKKQRQGKCQRNVSCYYLPKILARVENKRSFSCLPQQTSSEKLAY